MPAQRVHSTAGTVPVAAPAGVVYGMLADTLRWPLFLASYVHVEQLDFDGVEEQLLVWEIEADRVRSQHARRTLDPQARAVSFEQRDADWPGDTATGRWSVEPQGPDRSLLTLRQERPWAGASPTTPGLLEAEVRGRLARVREMAERWDRLDELLFSFENRVHVRGAAELVYDFLYRIGDWADLLPHVEWTTVTEDRPGVQFAAVGSCAAPDGGSSASEAVRLCFPHAGRIVHKERTTPALIAAHSGEWSLLPDEDGVTVVSAHQVMLRASDMVPVLGEGACPADAREYVREWLGRADAEVLGLAKWYAEDTVRRLR
ncbi:hypothetical protein ACFYNO_29275 [Kitasatospora sp. NPDC006697]|uniref:hypothetical protein n=1 Tax=Kitasatospora sp. NPDC006697 TaxID=3364020 RepID=UPI0036BFEE58